MRVRDALRAASALLAAAGVDDPAREARWLLAHALGVSLSDPALLPDRTLPEEAAGALWRAVGRRAAREPLAYILGTQEFMGLTLRVTPAVLVPRGDTAVLVEAAVDALREAFPGASALRVADVGTGSGCISLAICRLLPQARLWATEISPAALAVARENARSAGCEGRVTFLEGDLLDPLPPGLRLHAIVSNPPYVAEEEWSALMPEVREHEPRQALLAGPDGLDVIRRLVAAAPGRLERGGILALEVGYRQAGAVVALMQARGLQAEARPDTAGHLRAVVGRLVG